MKTAYKVSNNISILGKGKIIGSKGKIIGSGSPNILNQLNLQKKF